MFRRKKTKDTGSGFILQKEIDEILNIAEDQREQIERLNESLIKMHELCAKGIER